MKPELIANCKTAELQHILSVQSYGALIAVDKRSHLIVAVSENIERFSGQTPAMLLGQPWSSILRPTMVDSMSMTDGSQNPTLCRTITDRISDKQLNISNHTRGDHCIVELEPFISQDRAPGFSEKIPFIQQLNSTQDAQESAIVLMKQIADMTGFDRVMLYKFLPDWHGEVIAEQHKPGIQGFLGLRFPESDLPANARRILSLSLQRLIADINEKPSTILLHEPVETLDLAFSQLRAVHPVHIQYLKNIGVQASFSLSIICEGKLWGLIACHHLVPRVLSIPLRQACEELTRITSLYMSSLLQAQLERHRYEYRVAISEIRGALNAQAKRVEAINARIGAIKALFNADGICHHINGRDLFSGHVPDSVSFSELRSWFARLKRKEIFATSKIPPELSSNPSLVKYASGLLYIPLADDDFVVALRQEQTETVKWAGKPQSQSETDYSPLALTPRSSFQQWSEQVKGQAKAWHELDIESATILQQELRDYQDRVKIEAMALTDSLTGLANRLEFERQLDSAIKTSLESGALFAVFMIDLDKFKPVNDTLGHAAGDDLLIQVGTRLRDLLRTEDIVARLGGDEFAVILKQVQNQCDIELIAERILAEIKRPFTVAGNQVQIGASVGISLCPLDASSQNELLHEADLAMYEVKKEGRNGYKRFDPSMRSDQQAIEKSRSAIIQAFDNNEFLLEYQPVINVNSNILESFEVFCVWHHPEKGKLPAKEFIDSIETHHQATKWTEWGLETVFNQARQWKRKGFGLVPISLNINAKQFLNMDLKTLCEQMSAKYQIGTSWLRLDLDEQTLLINPRHAAEKITQLSTIGIMVNMDHFGKDLISLVQLTALRLASLKISGQLLNDKKHSALLHPQVAILKSISNVIHVPVVATQVENKVILQRVIDHGLPYAQGYGVCIPLDSEQAAKWIKRRNDSGVLDS